MSIQNGSPCLHNNSLAILTTSDESQQKPFQDINGETHSPSPSTTCEESRDDKNKTKLHDLSNITLNLIMDPSPRDAQTCSGSARRNSLSEITRPTFKPESEKVEKTLRRVSDTSAKSKTIKLLKKSDDSGSPHEKIGSKDHTVTHIFEQNSHKQMSGSEHESLTPPSTHRESKGPSPRKKTSKEDGQEKGHFLFRSRKSSFSRGFFSSSSDKSRSESDESPRELPLSKERVSRKSSPRDQPANQMAKTGNSVNFSLSNNYFRRSDPERNADTTTQTTTMAHIKKRLENQKLLQNYYECLKRVMANPSLRLQYDANKYLWCQYSNEQQKDEDKEIIQTILYTILKDAAFLKNTLFFSNKLISLEQMNEMITFVYPIKSIPVQIQQESALDFIKFQGYEDQFNLPLNDSNEFPKDKSIFHLEKIKVPEAQSSDESSRPMTMGKFRLQKAIEFKKTELAQLNRRVTDYINKSEKTASTPGNEVSIRQKIFVMNYYKTRVEDYLLFFEFLKTWIENRAVDQEVIIKATPNKEELKIKLEEPFNKNALLIRLNEEIEYLSIPSKFQYDNTYQGKPIIVSDFLTNLPYKKDSEINEVIEQISADMQIISLETFNLLTFDTFQLYESFKYSKKPDSYSDYLANFIYQTFNDLTEAYLSSQHNKSLTFNEYFFKYYMFFVKLCVELLKKNDYLSASAVSAVLQSYAIDWIMAEIKDVPRSFQKDLSFFKSICNMQESYEKLRKRTADCQKNKIFYTPSLFFFNKIIMIFEHLSNLDIDNSEIKSFEIKRINDTFNELRSNFAMASKNHAPLSNIYREIYRCNTAVEPIKPPPNMIHPSMKKVHNSDNG